jgi:hypothetical protein
VREVGVHLHEHLVAAVHADAEAVAVGVAEPVLLGANEHVDLTQLRGGGAGEVGGAIRAAVVHHEDVDVGDGGPHPAEHLGDVERLLVGGDDDQRAHGGTLPVVAPAAQHRAYTSKSPRPNRPSP